MGDQIPPDVVEAARRVTEWMQQRGYDRWQLHGCADRASVERLEREVHAYELLEQSDREFNRLLKERLSEMLEMVSRRR